MPRVIGTVAIVIVVIVIRVFTVDSGDVVKFNDRTVTLMDKFPEPFEPAFEQIGRYLGGEPISPDALKQSLSSATAELARMREELKSISVPDADVCRNYFNAAVNYSESLSGSMNSLNEIANYIAGHVPAQPDDVIAVEEMMARFVAADDLAMQPVLASQKVMADKYKITLEYR